MAKYQPIKTGWKAVQVFVIAFAAATGFTDNSVLIAGLIAGATAVIDFLKHR